MTTPTTIVIFGASGDLARRKLIPGLYNNFCKGRLELPFSIIGYSRSDIPQKDFQERMCAAVKEFSPDSFDEEKWAEFAPSLDYSAGSFDDDEAFNRLNNKIQKKESELGGEGNRLYYLSIAPRFFLPAVQQLDEHGMSQKRDGVWRRVIVEKPFGHDLASAKQLNSDLHKYLAEDQIYRIDHYLAKETVQNLLVFRFANTIFEPLWNRNYIDHVQITAAETVDVGHRAGYYDSSGVLRDMFQNHLMQLMALVSMEPPTSFDADAVRDEKNKVLRAIRPIASDEMAEHSVLSQYDGYLDADGVADGSKTPTYAGLELYVDNWRWKDVPFYLRSGKALAQKATEIIVWFKQPPHLMFPLPRGQEIAANYLAICIQPHEGLHLRFEVKVPDTAAEMRSVDMDFHYEDFFDKREIPEAYERLQLEALEGDATLFTRADGIEAAWSIIDPIIQQYQSDDSLKVGRYEIGSWGPTESDELLGRDGRSWRYGCGAH
ncbi:MAG: glucose-6-phosphate dehydrogenase [Chloroflexota bacterium]